MLVCTDACCISFSCKLYASLIQIILELFIVVIQFRRSRVYAIEDYTIHKVFLVSDALCFSAQALLEDVLLRSVKRLQILGIQDVLGAVLQNLHACASSNRDKIFLCNILLEIVLAHNTKKSALNFF